MTDHDTFETGDFTMTSCYLKEPKRYGKSELRMVTGYFPPDHDFVRWIKYEEKLHKSTFSRLRPRKMVVDGDYIEHPSDLAVDFKCEWEKGIVVLEGADGTEFAQDLEVPHGSLLSIEGDIIRWPRGNGVFKGRRGIKLEPKIIRIVRWGKEKVTDESK